ncbi:MAG TPA: DNA-binding protein [Cryomorphaceae bacterium]|nr:DNA-binding protein [Cryomorphaceae bacterium]
MFNLKGQVMSIPFRVVERGLPGSAGGPTRFYAQSRTSGRADLDLIADRVEKISTVSRADIKAVLSASVDIIIQLLQEARNVELGELGRLRVSLSSRGEDAPEKVTVNSIRSSKILFRPGPRLKDMQKLLKFTKDAPPAAPDSGQ